MKIIQLNALPTDEADKYVEQVGKLFHCEWKDCEPDYATEDSAILAVARRVAVEPLFVAIDEDGTLAGVAAISSDEYHVGICAANGMASRYIGRDFTVVERYRHQEFAGLSVWEHLLRGVLQWVSLHGNGANWFVVFADLSSPRRLVNLLARHGVRNLRSMPRRDFPARSVGILQCNVRLALASLDESLTNWC